MMDSLLTAFTDPAALAALVALVVMEVVLGIDNLVFAFGFYEGVYTGKVR